MVAVPNLAVLGEIVWQMSQSPLHKSFFISDLEWLVMTPVLLQQFRLYYDKDKPIGVVFWGTVDADAEARLAAGTNKFRPQDWKSGDRLWVTVTAEPCKQKVIAPFGGAVLPEAGKEHAMVAGLKEKVFPGRAIKFLTVGAGGVREVRVV